MREDASTYPFWLEEAAEAGRARLGLSEVFLEKLGEPCLGLELLGAGTRLERGESLGFLHGATRTLDLRAPFALELLALNPAALENPALVRLSPYARGWLAEVRLLKP
jgi:glycine cleavage system H lipoate-binding protein